MKFLQHLVPALLPAFLCTPSTALRIPKRPATAHSSPAVAAPALAQQPIIHSPNDNDAAFPDVVTPALPRLVIYFQTTHDEGTKLPISMLPLITQKHIALTHLIVCTFHFHLDDYLHLNDLPVHHPAFYTLWNETSLVKAAGVKVMGMIGGAAPGAFTNYTLDGDGPTFWRYYTQLRAAISFYELQGLDINVEQPFSDEGIRRLIRQLRHDFGPGFVISLAPVAMALKGTRYAAFALNLSGFDYDDLEAEMGPWIDFYNAQFYNGFGSMASQVLFDRIVDNGYEPTRVVAGQITSRELGGGFVEHATLNETVVALRRKHGEIGGIMGWEYFNGHPGGTEEPWRWAQAMTAILRPGLAPRLRMTPRTAGRLVQTLEHVAEAVAEGGGGEGQVGGLYGFRGYKYQVSSPPVRPIDYWGMVNEADDEDD